MKDEEGAKVEMKSAKMKETRDKTRGKKIYGKGRKKMEGGKEERKARSNEQKEGRTWKAKEMKVGKNKKKGEEVHKQEK